MSVGCGAFFADLNGQKQTFTDSGGAPCVQKKEGAAKHRVLQHPQKNLFRSLVQLFGLAAAFGTLPDGGFAFALFLYRFRILALINYCTLKLRMDS